MNARTSRLLRRTARVMFINDPHDPRQPEPLVLKGLKKRWNAMPRPMRGVHRVGIVNAVNYIIQNGVPR